MRRRTVTLTIALLVAGCGLVSGLDQLHVGDVDGSVEGGGSDGGVVGCEGGCGFSLPAGFSLVTYATALPVTCPSGSNPQDVVGDPTVASDACSCKCTMTTKATCTATSVQLKVSDAGLNCASTFTTLSGAPGCHTTSFTLPAGTRIDNAGAVVTDSGVCGTSPVADASTLATTPTQLCVPTSCAASDALCAPPPGQHLCAVAAGDVTCPDPFAEKHLVGTSASVVCSTCGTACTTNPPSCNGHLTLYTDTACNVGSQSASSCFSIGLQPMTVNSYDYSVTALAGCTTSATSSASTALEAEQTVCCRPGM